MDERNLNKEVLKARLAALVRTHGTVSEAMQRAVETLNGRPDDPASFDELHDLLERQPYRLAYWRVAQDEINYRRFFDINDLAALRQENRAVFDVTHRMVLQLVRDGTVDALRIDHPDGLYDPRKPPHVSHDDAGRSARTNSRIATRTPAYSASSSSS